MYSTTLVLCIMSTPPSHFLLYTCTCTGTCTCTCTCSSPYTCTFWFHCSVRSETYFHIYFTVMQPNLIILTPTVVQGYQYLIQCTLYMHVSSFNCFIHLASCSLAKAKHLPTCDCFIPTCMYYITS